MKPGTRIGAALVACGAFFAASVLAIEAPDRKPPPPKPAVSAPQDEPAKQPAPEAAPQTPAPTQSTPEPGAPSQQPPATGSTPPAPDAKAPANQPASADGKTTEPTDDPVDPEDAKKAAQAPKRFIPTTKSTADNSATFPVDI